MRLTGVARSGGIILLADPVLDLSEKTSMSKMNLKVEHSVPGRVRMKIPAGKGNPELLKEISDMFSAIPGIEGVVVNPTTGSVLLNYDVDRHDEFHGSFQEQYAMHAPPPQNGMMHGAST